MGGGAIAFVSGKAIAGMAFAQGLHARIAMGFGQNGGCRDSWFGQISLDDGARFAGQIPGERIAIYQDQLRFLSQTFNCPAHGEKGGLPNIDLVDLFNAGLSDTPAQCAVTDQRGEAVAGFFGEFLGVGQSFNGLSRIQDDGGGGNRSGPGASASFIDTADKNRRDHGALEIRSRGWLPR